MLVLQKVIDLITQSPGNLVYFLVTLFALQQALFAALGAYRAGGESSITRRWIWASIGMLAGRVLLIALGLLGVAGLVSPLNVLPSLERWILAATILGVGWAGVLGSRARRWQTWAFIVVLVLSVLAFGYVVAARSQWLSLPVNSLWEQAAVVGALVLVFVLTLVIRPDEWEWAIGILLFWGAGTAAQILLGDPAVSLDGWQRLASLVALPLLSLLVQRQALKAGSTDYDEMPLSDSIILTEIVQSVETARDVQSALILASSKLAGLLNVDVCCLALGMDDVEGEVQVVAIHPPTSMQIDPPQLKLSHYPGLETAYTDRQVVVANSPSRAAWLPSFYATLGFEDAAPLLILPLLHRRNVLGLLLLGGPHDRRAWTSVDQAGTAYEGLRLVAKMLADAVSEARTRKDERERGGRLVKVEAPERDAEQQKLTEMIEQAKKQVLALNSRIKVLIQEIKARDEEILSLNNELASRGQGISSVELEVWQGEVRQLAEDRDVLERKLQDSTQERDMLLAEHARLTQEMGTARQHIQEVEEHRERLEEAVMELQSRLAVAEARSAPAVQPDATMDTMGVSSNGSGVGFVVADESGQITLANALARQMLRLPEGDVVGVPLNGAYPDAVWALTVDDLLSENRDRNLAHVSLALETGGVEADMATLLGHDGEVDGLIVTLHSAESVSEQHEALVGLANDFRTPLTAITGYTDLLLGEQAGILTEMQQQFLARVRANVEQLNHMLNDLIQAVSPDSRRVELSPQPVNLTEVIESAIVGLAARFRERRLAVNLDLPSELSQIRVDRDSLYQIMLRLLSNAVLCSEEGTQVVISAREEDTDEIGPHMRISVADTGGGIASEDYSRVFRRFYRANQPLVAGMGETGIGMAIARALVEANGGRIWVESEAGKGSTFSFLLPVKS